MTKYMYIIVADHVCSNSYTAAAVAVPLVIVSSSAEGMHVSVVCLPSCFQCKLLAAVI